MEMVTRAVSRASDPACGCYRRLVYPLCFVLCANIFMKLYLQKLYPRHSILPIFLRASVLFRSCRGCLCRCWGMPPFPHLQAQPHWSGQRPAHPLVRAVGADTGGLQKSRYFPNFCSPWLAAPGVAGSCPAARARLCGTNPAAHGICDRTGEAGTTGTLLCLLI